MWLLVLVLVSATAEPLLGGAQYVKLIDRGGSMESQSSPGADIDAVALLRGDVVVAWATEVVAADIGDGAHGNEVSKPEAALGPVDHPPSTLAGFVALGGPGHSLVLKLGSPAQAGDSLTVYEVGRIGGREEPTEICVAPTPDGPWTSLGRGTGQFTVALRAAPPDPDSACQTRKLS